jgi:hypothetical protein
MAAHILHIGIDDCHRAAVLQSAGYDVGEYASLQQLATALDEMPGADAVILSESENIVPELVSRLVRGRSAAPAIFFCRSNCRVSTEDFDLVIPPLTPPEKWLKQVNSLLERLRMVRVQGKPHSDQAGATGLNKNVSRRLPLRERELPLRERMRSSSTDS